MKISMFTRKKIALLNAEVFDDMNQREARIKKERESVIPLTKQEFRKLVLLERGAEDGKAV